MKVGLKKNQLLDSFPFFVLNGTHFSNRRLDVTRKPICGQALFSILCSLVAIGVTSVVAISTIGPSGEPRDLALESTVKSMNGVLQRAYYTGAVGLPAQPTVESLIEAMSNDSLFVDSNLNQHRDTGETLFSLSDDLTILSESPDTVGINISPGEAPQFYIVKR